MTTGPRSHQAHLALDHVPELRQFVQAGLAQDVANPAHARVVLELEVFLPFGACLGAAGEQLGQYLLRVDHHRAELVALERLAILPDAGMAEEGRTAVALDQDCQHQHQRAQQQQRQAGSHEIEDSLDRLKDGAIQIVLQMDHQHFMALEMRGLEAEQRDAAHGRDHMHIVDMMPGQLPDQLVALLGFVGFDRDHALVVLPDQLPGFGPVLPGKAGRQAGRDLARLAALQAGETLDRHAHPGLGAQREAGLDRIVAIAKDQRGLDPQPQGLEQLVGQQPACQYRQDHVGQQLGTGAQRERRRARQREPCCQQRVAKASSTTSSSSFQNGRRSV